MTEQEQRFEYHGPSCWHDDCQRRSLEIVIAHFKERERYERKKTKIDFNPLDVRFTW
jgi:hypothetical protein